jgi:hypothetical protein
MREWMDLQIWKQRREEMMREAEQNRLGKALRDSRKRRGAGRAWAPAWELKRIAGSLLKRGPLCWQRPRLLPTTASQDGAHQAQVAGLVPEFLSLGSTGEKDAAARAL